MTRQRQSFQLLLIVAAAYARNDYLEETGVEAALCRLRSRSLVELLSGYPRDSDCNMALETDCHLILFVHRPE